MEGWYVAKAKPQKEGSLKSFLEQWGVEVFYPKVPQPGRNTTQQALFPTYMFCYLDPTSRVWPIARWAPGMAYFLNHDGEPTRIPEQMVEHLRNRVDQWNSKDVRQLKHGDKILVMSGPFAGLEGVFQRYIPSRERCRILLEAVGKLATVELPEWEIEEIKEESRKLEVAQAALR